MAFALNVRSEGMGVRMTAYSFGKFHSTLLCREQRITNQMEFWSPPAPKGREVALEGDEVYTRMTENLPPPRVLKDGQFILSNVAVAIG